VIAANAKQAASNAAVAGSELMEAKAKDASNDESKEGITQSAAEALTNKLVAESTDEVTKAKLKEYYC
jgi:hypothetical protein